MLNGTCHCGDVRIEIPRRPRSVTSCNCSVCRRYGTLWAYYRKSVVRIDASAGAIQKYSWGEKSLNFVRCAQCGCVTHWEPVQLTPASRTGINMRNFDLELIDGLRVRRLDGAATWKFLD